MAEVERLGGLAIVDDGQRWREEILRVVVRRADVAGICDRVSYVDVAGPFTVHISIYT